RQRLAIRGDELDFLAEDAVALERRRLQHVQEAAVTLPVEMLDGEFIGLLFVRAFLRIGSGERQVEAECDSAAGRIVAELLRPGAARQHQRCNTRGENAGEAGLDDIAAGNPAPEYAHISPP